VGALQVLELQDQLVQQDILQVVVVVEQTLVILDLQVMAELVEMVVVDLVVNILE
jgi:hypothetical protein